MNATGGYVHDLWVKQILELTLVVVIVAQQVIEQDYHQWN